MISFDLYEYFNINRLLLLAIGLWPHYQTKLSRIQAILIIGILMSFITLQIATLITAKRTPVLVINILSLTIFIANLIKYNTFFFKIRNLRYCLKLLEQFCSKLRNEKEIAILENYAIVMKRSTVTITLFTIFCLITFNLLPMWPRILGTFLLINDTQPRQLVLMMNEYFLDQERYFYFILLHTNATICVTAVVGISIITIIMVYLKYICGMFRIASYRMEQAMNINVCKDINSINEAVLQSLSLFGGMFFFMLVLGVSCMSLNLYRIIMFEFDIEELIVRSALIFAMFMSMFMMNYAAQEVTDHHEYIFETVYNTHWYVTPVYIQKIILFLLQNGTKTFAVKFGGVFVGSLENASMLASTSISYFTILYSMAQ